MTLSALASSLTSNEKAYLHRARRLVILQIIPGLIALLGLGGFIVIGMLYSLYVGDEQVTSMAPWEMGLYFLFGLFWIGLGIWCGVDRFREWRGLGRAIRQGSAITMVEAIKDETPNLAATALILKIAPNKLRLRMGDQFVMLPRLEWFDFLPTKVVPQRGITTGHYFYLLNSDRLSVDRQAGYGLLKTRISGVYALGLMLSGVMGIATLGADDAPATAIPFGYGFSGLALVLLAMWLISIRRNRQYTEALMRDLEPTSV